MKKFIFVTFILMLSLQFIFPFLRKGLLFRPEVFEINMNINNNFVKIPVKEMKTQHYDDSYKEKSGKFELRYIYFKNDETSDQSNVKGDIIMFSTLVILNIAGNQAKVTKYNEYDFNDLKNEVNGEYGIYCYINYSKTDFLKGYKTAYISFFYNSKYGIICQIILYNDEKIINSDTFLQALSSFKFKE